ncbi:MAG: thioredoxin-dependent thiol peroxidase [Chitinophagales bacterium]|nr:thioredoxin-dependent thiol peroxidase [Chitinophagales bacterium]
MMKIGSTLPDIDVVNQNQEIVNLSKLKGEKLIIYFYPKDDTPGCTAEACNFRDNYSELNKAGFKVIGISADDVIRHTKFIDKYSLPFTLLADTEKKLSNAFGVWGLKKYMGREYEGINRTTFIANEEGVITHVIQKVDTKNSAQQILDLLNVK